MIPVTRHFLSTREEIITNYTFDGYWMTEIIYCMLDEITLSLQYVRIVFDKKHKLFLK